MEPQKALIKYISSSDEALISFAKNTDVASLSAFQLRDAFAANSVQVQAQNRSLSSVRKILNEYNSSAKPLGLTQEQFAKSVGEGNQILGNYLNQVGSGEAKMGGYVGALVKAKSATLAMTAVTSLANAALSTFTSFLISAAFKGIDYLIHYEDKLIEKSEAAADAIKEISDGFKETQAKTKDIGKRFAELSQGINQITGANIDLSTEEYDEFLSLSNQLAELFPTLSRNYDENGNAIVQLSGDVDTIVGSLNDLIDAERQLANIQIADNLPDLFSGISVKDNQYKNEIEGYKASREELVAAQKMLTGDSFESNFQKMIQGNILTIESAGKSTDEFSTIVDQYLGVLDKLDIGWSWSSTDYKYDKELGIDVATTQYYKIDDWEYLSEEEIAEQKQQIKVGIKELAKTYDREIASLGAKIEASTNENKANWNGLTSSVFSWLSINDSYQTMSDEMQSAIQMMVNNVDFSSLNFTKWSEAEAYIQQNILDKMTSITKEGKAAFTELLTINSGDYDIEGYLSEVKNKVSTIVKNSSFTADEIFEFTGYNDVVEKLNSTFGKGWEFKSPELSNWIKDLSLGDLEIASKISLNTDTAQWNLDKWKEELEDYRITNSEIITTISAEQETSSKIASVRSEAFSATGLSPDSISAVESVFGDIEGYSYDKLFANTANGVHLNVDAFEQLNKAYKDNKKIKIDSYLKDLQKQLGKVTNELEGETDALKRANLEAEQVTLNDKIREASELQAMYNGLTSAYNEYLQALETPNQAGMFDTIAEGFEKIKELIKQGRIGADEVLKYTSMFTGKDYIGPTAANDALTDFIALNNKIGSTSVSWVDILQGGQKGGEKFVQMLAEAEKGWASYNKTTGKAEIFPLDSKDVAEYTGATVELIDALLLGENEFGIYNQAVNDAITEEQAEKVKKLAEAVKTVSDAIEESVSAAVSANQYLKDEGFTDYTFNFNSNDIENVGKEIEKATELVNKFKQDGKLDISTPGAQEALDILTALLDRKHELENGEIAMMRVDVSQVEGQLGEAITAFQEAKNLFDLREYNIKIGADTTELDNGIIDAVAKLDAIPDEILTKLNIDKSEFKSSIDIVTSDSPDVTVEAKVKAANDIQTMLAGVTPDLLVNLGVAPESIANLDLGENKDVTVDAKLGDTSEVDSYAPTATGTVNWRMGDTSSIDSYAPTAIGTVNWVNGSTPSAPTGGNSPAQGTATPSGSTFAQGTAFVRGDWGVKGSGVALGGKLLPHYLEISWKIIYLIAGKP